VRSHRPEAPDTSGPIRDAQGRDLGHHDGIEAFTIGQRRGLGVAATGAPQYVVDIEPVSHVVTIGPRTALERLGLEASGLSWQSGRVPPGPTRCLAQIRARHRAVDATVEPLGDGNRVRVRFETPQPAVAPGQVVVLYQDDLVLGGGWIDRALDA
jgi:tRNA-specific 2-thiouridylase